MSTKASRRRSRELDMSDGSGQPLLDDDDTFANLDMEEAQADYLSDSALGDLRQAARRRGGADFGGIRSVLGHSMSQDKAVAASRSSHGGSAAEKNIVTVPRRAPSTILKVMEKQHMPKFQAQRDRKARKKNIARFQRTDEVEKFRGRVSAVCVSMELATDKLLPFLEKWNQDNQERQSKDDTTSSEGLAGTWSFKMYTDVLHAQNANVDTKSLVDASIAVQQEYSKQAMARKQRQRKSPPVTKDDGHYGSSPPDIMGDRDQPWVEAGDEEAISADDEDFDELPPDAINTLGQAAATIADLTMKHVFFFQYGCLVFWGLEPAEEKLFMDLVTPFADDLITEESEKEHDDMTFFYSTKTRMFNDEISLQSNSSLEKLSISFALAQAIKLSVLEIRVEETFESTRIYPQELAAYGSIALSQTDVSKMIGHLFIVKAGVNLESDMLNTPDFFWDNDEWEPNYVHARKYLELDNRVNVLNKRMEVLSAMFDMLRNQLEVRHATRLEWIIIWLIVAEVALEVIWNIIIHDILGLFDRPGY